MSDWSLEEHLNLVATPFGPPAALTEVADITSETILLLVQSSLDNIKQQLEVERQQRETAAQALAAQKAAQALAAAEDQKGKGKAVDAADLLHPDGHVISSKPQKASWFRRRILHHIRDQSSDGLSESSAAGAARARPEEPSTLTRLVYKHIKPSSSAEKVTETVECVSCLEDIDAKAGVKTTCHYYCKECFQQLITIALDNEDQWPPKCCLNPVPERTIMRHIPTDLFKQYRLKAQEFGIPIDKRLYCCEPDCGEWMRKVDRGTNTARCSKGHRMCVLCRQAAHPYNEVCPDDRDRALVDRLAEEEGWRRCISCSVLVEHREACQHMTCRCGAEFCYVCGTRWRTCDCTMEQLQQRKNDAAARHAERQRRDADDNAWLQEALQAIEAAQREEAQQEEIRQAELARERAARREDKYNALRVHLAQLNETQERLMLEMQSQSAVAENLEYTERHSALVEQQTAERAALRTAAAAKIANAELEWGRELRERALWSRQLEAQYGAAQKAFWAQFKGGEARRNQMVFEYRRELYEHYQRWCRWRDDEMAHFRWRVEEDEAVRNEALDVALRKLDDTIDEVQTSRQSRNGAERKWFDLVTAERARLLAELEAVEAETEHHPSLDLGMAM